MVLGLVRRHDGSKKLLDEIKNLSEIDKARMIRLGSRWLSGPEHTAFKVKLNDIHNDRVGIFSVRLPFGEIRAVQETVKSVLRDLL